MYLSLCAPTIQKYDRYSCYLLHFHSTILQKSTVDKWWFCHKLYPFRHIICFYFFSWKNKLKQIISHLLVVVSFITARKRSLGQGNIFTPVCHSIHRGGVHGCSGEGGMRGFIRVGGVCGFIWGGMRGFIWGMACMVLFGGDMHGFIRGGMYGFSVFRIQWDTVNEWAVRILLECILVSNNSALLGPTVQANCIWSKSCHFL